jgi:hypothetical protein
MNFSFVFGMGHDECNDVVSEKSDGLRELT